MATMVGRGGGSSCMKGHQEVDNSFQSFLKTAWFSISKSVDFSDQGILNRGRKVHSEPAPYKAVFIEDFCAPIRCVNQEYFGRVHLPVA